MRKPKEKGPLLGREYYIGFEIYRRTGQEMHFIWFGMKNGSGVFCRRCWTKGFHKMREYLHLSFLRRTLLFWVR